MPQVSETFDRYDTGNNVREDLSDVIYNISPTEVPIQSNFGRGSAQQTYKEWSIDELDAAANNAHIDGDEFDGLALSKADRVGNYSQISRKDIVVSRRANIVNKAGRKSEIAYQIAKMGKALRRDVEVGVNMRKVAVEGSSSTAMETAGIPTWIRTNLSRGGSGTAPTLSNGTEGFPNGVGTAGTARALTESDILDTVRLQYEAGGNPNMIQFPPSSKQGMSNFLFGTTSNRVATQYQDQGASPRGGITVVGAVDVYVTDFSILDLVPNRFSPAGATATEVTILDTEYWEIAYLDGYKTETIAKIGDHERRMLLVDWSLCSLNEAASGIVADINDTLAVAA